MTLRREIPGAGSFELEHLLLDVNGTIANRAHLIEGVEERIALVREQLEVHLLSADTLHNLDETAAHLEAAATRVSNGTEKRDYAEKLGPDRCAAIGNGVNDVPMLQAVRFGIAVIGPEGAGGPTLQAADAVCRSILDAFDLLLEADTTASTLRP
ncbi:MAG: HAD family hydrolase [Solirubrobacterales bacterium]